MEGEFGARKRRDAGRSSSSVARLGHANACSGREEKHGEAMGARACEETGKDASIAWIACAITRARKTEYFNYTQKFRDRRSIEIMAEARP